MPRQMTVPTGYRWVIHDQPLGKRPISLNSMAAGNVDCLGSGVTHMQMYIQDALDARGTVEVCGRCMPRADAIAYDVRVEQVKVGGQMEPEIEYVAHIKIERVVRTPKVPFTEKSDRSVTEVGQAAVRSSTLDGLRSRIVHMTDIFCSEDGPE